MTSPEYYSFRNVPKEMEKSLKRFEHNGSIVFQHDLTLGIPDDYQRCDLIYCEPSWAKGYKIFSDRAEKDTFGSYNRYIEVLSDITHLNKPVAMILGKSALKRMNPDYMSTKRVILNGHWETIYGWNINLDDYTPKGNTSFDLAKSLAYDYECVGDMSCGYGNVGKAFHIKGKKFVMSDINGKLMYDIAKDVMNYEDIS